MTSNSAAQPESSDRRRILIGAVASFLLPIVILLPFANKAFNIDDTVYVWVAQQIAEHPLDFYGFQMNWDGTATYVYEFNQNPPGVSYYLAFVGVLFGWSETALHLSMLLFAGALSLGTYLLAREFSARPFVAVLAAVSSPVVFVSSTSVMSDIPMSAWYVWAVYLWVRGERNNNAVLLTMSMVCLSLAMLHKYFGLTAVLLLGAYTLMKRRRAGWWMLYALIPVFVLAIYQLLTYRLYGVNLFSNAAGYALKYSLVETNVPLYFKAEIGLIFLGGCFAGLLFLTPLLWDGRIAFWLYWSTILACVFVVFTGTIGNYGIYHFNWPVAVHAGIFIVAGLQILALAILDAWKSRSAESILILCWIVGTLCFSAFLNWSVTARTILPMAPAVAILVARRLDRRGVTPGRLHWKTALPFALSIALSFCVAWGDFYLAEAQRRAAAKFRRDDLAHPGTYYYKGHWGFQYYMDQEGIAGWDPLGLRLLGGDRIVVSENGPTVSEFNYDVARAWRDLRYNTPAASWVTTMHPYVGAGFYAHLWGPLPYAFGDVPEEIYAVYELGDFRNLPPPGEERRNATAR